MDHCLLAAWASKFEGAAGVHMDHAWR